MNKELIIIKNGTAKVSSTDLAIGFETTNKSILNLIRSHEKDLKIFGKVTFQKASTRSGQIQSICELNEPQTTLLLTYTRSNESTNEFRVKLIKKFFEQRMIIEQLIMQQKDPNWMNVRKDGKAVYFQKTDIIKNFIGYAISQGSKSAKMYYTNFANMENKAMFIFEQKYPNMREVLTIKQLMQVATADDVIEKAIKEGMDKEMFYKDIFQLAKERIVRYVEIIGQSPILGLEKK